MVIELDIQTLLSFLVPGGQKNKVAHQMIGPNPTDQNFVHAKRALDGQLKGSRNLTDKSWENLIRVFAEKAGEEEVQTNRKMEEIFEFQERLEEVADSRGNVGKYPLGILGFISTEILPNLRDFAWIKPTLDIEINLTVAFRKSNNRSERVKALAQSDMAKTITGKELLRAYSSTNNQKSSAIYCSGLAVLSWFQILSTGILGKDIEPTELEMMQGCADLTEPQKSSVDAWFYLLKSLTQSESWEGIYSNIAGIRNMEFDWSTKKGKGKLRKIRQGETPFPFDQATKLIFSFIDELQNDISILVALERAYKISVLVDNFHRDWNNLYVTFPSLPKLDLRDALHIGYKAAQERSRDQ